MFLPSFSSLIFGFMGFAVEFMGFFCLGSWVIVGFATRVRGSLLGLPFGFVDLLLSVISALISCLCLCFCCFFGCL